MGSEYQKFLERLVRERFGANRSAEYGAAANMPPPVATFMGLAIHETRHLPAKRARISVAADFPYITRAARERMDAWLAERFGHETVAYIMQDPYNPERKVMVTHPDNVRDLAAKLHGAGLLVRS
jgi:hypothetical protein